MGNVVEFKTRQELIQESVRAHADEYFNVEEWNLGCSEDFLLRVNEIAEIPNGLETMAVLFGFNDFNGEDYLRMCIDALNEVVKQAAYRKKGC